MKVAVVEDDEGVAQAIVDSLRSHRLDAVHFARGSDILGCHRTFDLVLLDLGLPDRDGLEVLRGLREVSTVPVIILTARSDERTVVRGLRLGADDYLVKPARAAELLARIESVNRRSVRPAATDAASTSDPLRFGEIEIAVPRREVRVAGEPVALTPTEFALLAILVEQPGVVVSRSHLMDRIWGNAFVGTSRSLDVHMTGLRGKIGRRELVETVRGVGFRWAG